jgi:hypothetical protein
LLGEVAAEVEVLGLGKKFVMVCLGDWCLGRCEIALGEEAGLARGVNLGCRSSRRVGSRSTTRRSRGR